MMYRNTESWVLHADVYGTPEYIEVYIEVPGVERDELELEVTPRSVIVSGLKKRPCRGADALAIEIQTGRFRREVHLPSRVETDSAVAELKSGVLHVRLKRTRPVKVSIQVNPKKGKN